MNGLGIKYDANRRQLCTLFQFQSTLDTVDDPSVLMLMSKTGSITFCILVYEGFDWQAEGKFSKVALYFTLVCLKYLKPTCIFFNAFSLVV